MNHNEAGERLLEKLVDTSRDAATRAFATPADYHKAFVSTRAGDTTLEQAILGGALADRVAYAFTAGYQSALRSLYTTLQETDEFASFCITEEGGNSPKVLEATLTPTGPSEEGRWLLHGTKTFVTGCDIATHLLIAASEGLDEEGRKKLRMVHIGRERRGLSIELMPALPFVPEVAHGVIACDGVEVKQEELLPGDGYLGYIKPFRTIEDIHVAAAILGYVTSRALATGWPKELVEECFALLLLHRQLPMLHPSSKALHVALAGARRQLERLLAACEAVWETQDAAHFAMWQRDKKLLRIAGSARSKRAEVAWDALVGGS